MDELEIEDPEQLNDLDKVKDLDRAQYEIGFRGRLDGEPFDDGRCAAWQLGWHAAARKTG